MSRVLTRQSDGRTVVGRILWLIVSAGVTVLAYLLLLGWNAKMELTPEEPGAVGMECTGPYEPRQIVALGVVLAVLVVAGTWFRHEYVVPATSVTTLIVLFTIDAVTVNDPCSDTNLLPLGVLMLFVGSIVAATVLVVFTVAIRNRRIGE
jgi:hypothetical protein